MFFYYKVIQKSNVQQNYPQNKSQMIEYDIGRAGWLRTTHAVVLHQKMRTSDKTYNDILQRLLNCECTTDDHEILLSRVVCSKKCNVKSLDEEKWKDATILVFCNEIKQEFNNHFAISRALENKQNYMYV